MTKEEILDRLLKLYQTYHPDRTMDFADNAVDEIEIILAKEGLVP